MARAKRPAKAASSKPPTADAREAMTCRKWKRELEAAGRREKDFREYGEKVLKRYRADEVRSNVYNILWANTEVLRPAVYNSKPDPDVRRRFRDADPVGKAVGLILERSLFVMIDSGDTDRSIKNDVLDGLLVGRGVSRIRYIPTLGPAGSSDPKPAPNEDGPGAGDDRNDEEAGVGGSLPPTPNEEHLEQVEYEQTYPEHVDWRDFRHGYGRVWGEVPWVGFRHRFTKDDATDKFGADAISRVKFAAPQIEEERKDRDLENATTKLAEFWEVWDKEGERVFFLNEQAEARLFPTDNPDGEPPLDFEGFFPCPEPLYIVENTGSLMPIALYSLYETQAKQLDKLTARIDKIVAACRLRGIYDAKIPELRDLIANDDNELTPTENAANYADAGGLEKAIAWLPTDQVAKVLSELYSAREKQKQIIDEILGISDIVRGATDPNETLGAQQLKQGNYSIRLRRMQDAVKRYVCDLIRLASQVMASRYERDTFEKITNLKFPTREQKFALQAKAMMLQRPPAPPMQPPGPPGAPHPMPAATPIGAPAPPAPPPVAGPLVAPHPGAPVPVGAAPMPPHPGAPPMPPPGAMPPHPPGAPQAGPQGPPQPPKLPPAIEAGLKLPTWEDIIELMRSPALRQFRVDVETDSMIAGTLESDMQGLAALLKAIEEILSGLAPLVEQQALPVEAAKEIVMSVIRRARLGSAVEDAFDKMAMPQQKPDPKAAAAQGKAQADIQVATIKAQLDAHVAQVQQQAQSQQNAQEQALEQQRTAQKQQFDAMQAKLDAFVKIIVATISATKRPDEAVQPRADAVVAGAGGAPMLPAPAGQQ